MKKVIGNNKKWFLGLIACLIVAILFPQIVRVRFVWNLLSLIRGMGSRRYGMGTSSVVTAVRFPTDTAFSMESVLTQ